MTLQQIAFEGLAALQADELVDVAHAIDATNCQVDDGTIFGRNGYRSANSSAIGSGNTQGLWRFRTGPSSAWSLVARGGSVYSITDPSTELASDGTVTTPTNGSGLFGINDNISGAQLGTYFYLASDNLSYYWKRARNASGTVIIESQTPIPKGALPTYSAGQLTFVPFGDSTHLTPDTGITVVNAGISTWVNISGTVGKTAVYDIGSQQNWEGCKWLFVACSPETQSGGGGSFAVAIAAEIPTTPPTPGVYFTLGTISDPPGGHGSPYCAYLSLASIDSTTLSAIRYIQFKQVGGSSGTDTDPFSALGYMVIPTAPAGTTQYFVTFANIANVGTATGTQSSTTLQDTSQSWTTNQWQNYTVAITGGTGQNQSAAVVSNTSNTLTVADWETTPVSGSSIYQIGNNILQESVPTDTLTIYHATAPALPTFHAAKWNYNSFNDVGTASTDPSIQTIDTCYNIGGGLAMPTTTDLGVVYTINGTAPATGTFNTVRLWRLTSDGYRLAKSASITAGGGYSLRDDGGDTVLAAQNYIPGGLPPPATALTARGGRLICGGDPSHPNRLTISSYVPINTSTEGQGLAGTNPDPFPQFPSIPQQESDGWAFDISPTAAEQILWLGNGDALYILTNEALYAMNDLTPNSPPFRIFERGVLGRRAAIWAEGSLHRVWGIEEKLETGAIFWASHDGIFTSYNRVSAHEITKAIRRVYRRWLQPDSATVLAYQDRKLYCTCGTRMLRFDFVTETWTRHILAHTMQHSANWRDPGGSSLQRLFYLASDGNLYRWQPGTDYTDANRATSDAGTTIPAWTYSTGYAAEGVKTRLTHIYADVTGGTVTVNAYKDSGTTGPPTKSFATSGEHEYSVAAYVSGSIPQLTAATGYKWRLALSGANSAQVRRVMWDREQTSGHGG